MRCHHQRRHGEDLQGVHPDSRMPEVQRLSELGDSGRIRLKGLGFRVKGLGFRGDAMLSR